MIPFLRKECVEVNKNIKDRAGVLKEITRLGKKSSLLSHIKEEEILEKLTEREDFSTTALPHGIAIPHCSFDDLQDFCVGLLLLPEGVDFGSEKGEKSHFIFFIIGAASRRNQHVQVLSSISRLAKNKELLKSLKKAQSRDELLKLLQADQSKETSDVHKQEKQFCQLVLYIQREELFNDLLELLSAEVKGSISVIESHNAGHYLHRLPLFSSFWTEGNHDFCRIMLAVIDKKLLNDTVRRVNMLRSEEEGGILITAQDIIYCDGQIDF